MWVPPGLQSSPQSAGRPARRSAAGQHWMPEPLLPHWSLGDHCKGKPTNTEASVTTARGNRAVINMQSPSHTDHCKWKLGWDQHVTSKPLATTTKKNWDGRHWSHKKWEGRHRSHKEWAESHRSHKQWERQIKQWGGTHRSHKQDDTNSEEEDTGHTNNEKTDHSQEEDTGHTNSEERETKGT